MSTTAHLTIPKGNWTGVNPVIRLPADQYLHPDAPTEWWWHTGTLKAGKRIFGFEINAASFMGQTPPFAFSQLMLTDVANKVHYQQAPSMSSARCLSASTCCWCWSLGWCSTPLSFARPSAGTDGDERLIDGPGGALTALQTIDGKWAESDPKKAWYVTTGAPGVTPTETTNWVTMNAPQRDPTKNMAVKASLFDKASGKIVTFDLNLSQKGPPFIVWGTGVTPEPTPPNPKTNNFYYSLTRLHAKGTVSIGGQSTPVTGLTWMDHQYGLFGSSTKPVLWFLQDMQLDNGVHISHFVTFPKDPPKLKVRVPSNATIQFPDGTTYYDTNCFLTPVGKTWTNPTTKILFFLEFKIEIPSFNATFHVSTPVPDQDFPVGPVDTYEGVATAKGHFNGAKVQGTAWNEQQP